MTDEPQQTIKVVDRRRSASSEQAESSDRFTSSSSASAASEKSSTEAPAGPAGGAVEATGGTSVSSAQEQQPESRPNQVDFPSFVLSFYTQALIMLGEIPNPETGLLAANKEAARQTIDILEMIEVKTKGNLSADESRLISEVVTSLQMAYVNKLK